MARGWDAPGFAADARAWVCARAARGEPERFDEVKLRPWAATYRASWPGECAYFKALCPAAAHEPALATRLDALWPARVPQVWAADPERAWLLVADGGPTLREVRGAGDLSPWERILPAYAELQQDAARHASSWLELGVPDRRLHALPEQVAALAADPGVPAGSLDPERLHAALAPECERLAALGLPPTLDHGDLHDSNVLAEGERLFDWGDSALTHPFFTLTVTLNALDPPPEARERLVDAYLEPWTSTHSRGELRDHLPLALKLGAAARALDWHGALAGASADDVAEWGHPVASWLRRYLDLDAPRPAG